MKVALAGSGPAGVAAAKALLDGGLTVDLLDFGNEIDGSAEDLASRLRSNNPSAEDLAQLRLACAPEGIAYTVKNLFNHLRGKPSTLNLLQKTRLGSSYTTQDVDWGIPLEGPNVARSLAKGGVSNIWGAACYPLADEDYADWPVSQEEMALHYRSVASMLSITEQEDDLAAVYPIYGSMPDGPTLNPLAAVLLEHWRKHHEHLVGQGILCGRSRLAVRTEETGEGQGCQLCGLCLYGCPYDAIYRADWTLAYLSQNPSFRYLRPLWVQRFQEQEKKVIVEAFDMEQKTLERLEYDALFLAAGTVSTLRIVADAQQLYDRTLHLFDNDMYLVPILSTAPGINPSIPLQFSLSELVMRWKIWGYPVHIQFYGINEQIVDQLRSLLATLPDPIVRWTNALFARLLVAFIYLPGNVSAHTEATIRPGAPVATVAIGRRRRAESRQIARHLIRYLACHRKALGLYPIGPILPHTPAGPGGAHPVAALPMKHRPGPLETYPDGRLYGTERVFIVDGAALPSLPVQNSTYTIMANAHRIGTTFAKRQIGRSNFDSLNARSQPPEVPPSPESNEDDRFGRSRVDPVVLKHDHHHDQYKASAFTAAYHRMVLRRAVQMARLQPGMHVLDYGCGRQRLRQALPPGVHYTGYDAVPELSGVDDPRGGNYDMVFAIQVLMYLDEAGLREWTGTFAEAAKHLIVMVPARNFLKDEVLDRLFDLKELRDRMMQSRPLAIHEQLSRKFYLVSSQNLFWMGELSRWQRKSKIGKRPYFLS